MNVNQRENSMSIGITFEELLIWNEQSAEFWKSHFEANPSLLELPCGIGGAATVQELVRHIWGAELRWFERLAGTGETPREQIPTGPLEALFGVHQRAIGIFGGLLAGPEIAWNDPYVLRFDWIPEDRRTVSRRKIAAHALIHGQRHWAQIATLVRSAGFPSNYWGDVLFANFA
jgi:uncharacterized damage-inducible protein DinB